MYRFFAPLASALVLATSALAADGLATLEVSFTDPEWNGRTVPKSGICQPMNGKGDTPPLRIAGIPAEANALIIEYSDRTFGPMNNGGHGILRYSITPGEAEVTLPATPGMTDQLPEGVVIEKHNLGARNPAPGYRGPCSGGRGNLYEGVVKAVNKSDTETRILGEGKFRLGFY